MTDESDDYADLTSPRPWRTKLVIVAVVGLAVAIVIGAYAIIASIFFVPRHPNAHWF